MMNKKPNNQSTRHPKPFATGVDAWLSTQKTSSQNKKKPEELLAKAMKKVNKK